MVTTRMNTHKVCTQFFIAFLSLAGAHSGSATAPLYDVVVYGGTPAGVTAAIEAKRQGASVVLLVPEDRLGGLTTSGLGATDVSSSAAKAVVGGLGQEFYSRIRKHYQKPAAWRVDSFEHYQSYVYWGFLRAVDQKVMWTFEPKVALQVFTEMLEEAKVPVVRGTQLDRSKGVRMEGGRIAEIRMINGANFRGKCFIDTTYEGDLMAAAGVSYVVGRESRAIYGESLAGIHHQTGPLRDVDAYVKPGDPQSGLLPLIEPRSPGEEGTGDNRVMAYCKKSLSAPLRSTRGIVSGRAKA